MKRLLKLLTIIFAVVLLSGCSIVFINEQSIDEIVNSVLDENTKLKSVSLEGYSYYLPQGVSLKGSSKLNSTLYYNKRKMYLYVDLVSYYHKAKNTYKENNNSFYSRKINKKNKTGYLEITELKNEYFIEFMYNYSKVECYVLKEDLNKTLTVIAYVLNSVDFNDKVLDSLIGEGSLNYKEEQYNIYKSNGNDGENFLDIAEQYDEGRINSKDEDTLEIENNLE
jgi:hypothetical protein